jgi:hypothetical protein
VALVQSARRFGVWESLVVKVAFRLPHGGKKVSASDDLAPKPSETVPRGSAPNLTTPPTPAANALGMLGWVVASVSILVGFFVIAAATRIDGEQADHRRASSFIPQQTKMVRSQRRSESFRITLP